MADGSLDGASAFPLPEGAWIDGADVRGDLAASFDVVVVGSGAAGAVAAQRLARAGLRVAIVEEGPWLAVPALGGDVIDGFGAIFRDAGMQAIEGRSFIPLLQGRCVGGSTVVNSAIAWRVPEEIVADWRDRFGVAFTVDELAREYDSLEAELGVREVADAVLGENNARFLAAAEAAGISAQRMRRYDRGCEGSGRCLTGCAAGRKQAMSVTMVPDALARGARLFSRATVSHVELDGDRARAVVARVPGVDGRGAQLTLHATRGVVVAASTVQTPRLLRASGVRSPHLGEHFQVHPGLALLARFDDVVDMTFGATQGAESVAFRSERFKLETIAMPPELVLARMPGVGVELAARAREYPHVGMWATQIRARAEGRVTRTLFGRDVVRYTPTAEDLAVARRAAAVLARLFFDVGAREVWPGIHGAPGVLHSADEARALEDAPLDARAYSFIATHLFGAARMAADPRAGVVGNDFAVHGTRGLYVVDSSVFPTNLGVNPQHTIMALASLAATRIAATRET